MRVHEVEQDLTGILDWRLHAEDLHAEDNFSGAKQEIYEAEHSLGEDSPGKHIRLLIRRAPSGAITDLAFRRAEQCRCQENGVYGHSSGCFRYGGGFNDDGWN